MMRAVLVFALASVLSGCHRSSPQDSTSAAEQRQPVAVESTGDPELTQSEEQPPPPEPSPTPEVTGSSDASVLESPLVPVPAFPLKAGLALDLDSSHGCSRSFARQTWVGNLELNIKANGAATLKMSVSGHYMIGPSRGMFTQGKRNFSHHNNRIVAEWSGVAKRSPMAISIRFKTQKRAEVDNWVGQGEPPLPAPTEAPTTLEFRCKSEQVAAYGPVPDAGFVWPQPDASTAPIVALSCEPIGAELFSYQKLLLIDGRIPLGTPDELFLGSQDGFFPERRALRRR